MHISKLKIKNFKCFDEVEINFDPNFNLIIGENNSGKSTIFEALRLWQIAFNKFLKDRTNNKTESSFYSKDYFSFTIDELSFLRIDNFKNLFFKTGVTIEVSLTLKNEDNFAELPIFFNLNTEEQNLRFNLCTNKTNKSKVSNYLLKVIDKTTGSSFKDMLLMTYINPIFHIPVKEAKYQKGYILEKLHHAKANEVIRNLIDDYAPIDYQTSRNKSKKSRSFELVEMEKTLHEIIKNRDLLKNEIPIISFSSNLKPDKDVNITIFAKNNEDNSKVEISQLGSGTINIINILSVLAYGDYEKFLLNVLLLDEPDSHLHANNQKRLYRFLENVSFETNKQIFIITHNSSLISQFENVLFIKNNQKEIKPITLVEYLENYLKEIDEVHYNVMKELSEGKKEKDLLIQQLNDIKNINVPLVYTEGPSDIIILENAFSKLYPEIVRPFNLINGSCANHLKNIFENDSTFEKNENQQIAIFDFDDAYNQWNGVKNYELIENNPYKCLTKKHKSKNGYVILLPVPRIGLIESQVINDNDNFKHKSVLEIEHLFFDIEECKEWFISEKNPGGVIYQFKGDKFKSEFSKKTDNFSKESFKNFIPLFEKIAEIIGFELPKANLNA